MMTVETKTFELPKEYTDFVQEYERLGFENESAMIGFALKFLQREIKRQDKNLHESLTSLFTELYVHEYVMSN